MEHAEELALGYHHVVAVEAGDDGVVHDWLVGLVFEVAVPARAELLAGPAVHHLELFFGWTDLDSSLDPVCRQWTCSVDIPLLEYRFLHLGITTHKVVKGLNTRLCPVRRKGEANRYVKYDMTLQSSRLYLLVVLEVEPNAWEVDQRLDTDLAQLLWVTDTRALEDEWRTERPTRDNDLLASLDDAGEGLTCSDWLGGDHLDTDCAVAL